MDRILTLTTVFVLSLPSLAQDGADPVVRMGAMRNTLARAKAIRVTFESEIKSEKGKDWVKGTMLIGEGNKARVEMKMQVSDKAVDLLMISDGKTMQTTSGDGKPREKPAETNLYQNMLTMIERAGIAVPMFTIRTKKDAAEQDLAKALTITERKQTGTEKEIYTCSYRLNVEGNVLFRVNLSMGLNSNLPIRRVLEVEKGANQVTVTETYQIELNPMLKEDTFELRK